MAIMFTNQCADLFLRPLMDRIAGDERTVQFTLKQSFFGILAEYARELNINPDQAAKILVLEGLINYNQKQIDSYYEGGALDELQHS